MLSHPYPILSAALRRRTNFDCDNLEKFLNSLGGGGKGPGPNPYSCVVLAGGRAMEERRRALQVGGDPGGF